MTQSQIAALKDDPAALMAAAEADRTSFNFLEGRYFLAMTFMNIPEQASQFGKGGDITALIFRKESEPDKWWFQYRFRHYTSDQAWGSKDTRNWYCNESPIECSEEEMLAKAKEALGIMSKISGNALHVLEIRGDVKKFQQIVRERKPFWLHVGISDSDAAKGGDPKGN